ncbi:hypothetical protein ACHQM5_029006 [Ranunculus cassubicifolius]
MIRSHQVLVFLAFMIISFQISGAQESVDVAPIDVGVILDMDSWVGKVSNSCMEMAISDFYATYPDYKTRLVLHTRNSKSDVIGAAFAAVDLVSNEKVKVIIGPQKSDQTEFIVDLGDKLQVPIISFSATIPSIYSRSDYFIRTTPDDHTQVKAIASIAQAFRWRKVILLHEDTDYGNRLVPHLINAFQETNTRISYRNAISPVATDDQIMVELHKLVLMQTSVFIVHMSSSFGSRFFLNAKARGMMTEGYAWIVTNGLMNVLESLEPNVIASMQGVLGVNPYTPRSEKVEDFIKRWKKKFIKDNPDYVNAEMITFGLHAYDSIWALAIASENVEVMKSNLNTAMSKNTTKFLHMEVSPEGPKLRAEISKTEFEGMSGEFLLVNGQLEPSAIQIINIIGKGGREIGFWSKHGISREFNFSSGRPYSSPKEHFRGIIWPGESTKTPKGWVIPMDGKKLRIGVPVQDGFKELVNVTQDPLTNATRVLGYCIDVFKSAIKSLEYTIPYEFVPYRMGNYNDLIQQVYSQKYDAVVGDVTITARRSQYVDFSFPYTEGGVWMIVPLKPREEPKDTMMYNVLFAPFIVLGVLAVFLEVLHLNNFINFPSRTLSPEHGKNAINFLYKVSVGCWILLILGLATSYLYTLSSMLTVERLEPVITDFNDLVRNGEYVGHRQGSFVVDLLKKFHFDASKLKPYNSPEECHELLSKGSQNGGVAAVFDERPYIDVILAKYCSLYTQVGPTHKTDGYGFVFPLGSPLVSDLSNAVLKVIEGNEIIDITQSWFPPTTTCGEERWNLYSTRTYNFIVQICVSVCVLGLLVTLRFKDRQEESQVTRHAADIGRSSN